MVKTKHVKRFAIESAKSFYQPKKMIEHGIVHVAQEAGFALAAPAFAAFQTYEGAKHFNASFQAFKGDPSLETGYALGGNIVKIIGLERLLTILFRYVLKLAIKARLEDRRTGDEMVSNMKSAVPVDNGNLLNGITAQTSNDYVTVSAYAVHGEDYAPFVEYGTGDNGKVADSEFFADGTDAGVPLHGAGDRHHAATQPQPFFWPAAKQGLAEHRQNLDQAADQSASEEGLL